MEEDATEMEEALPPSALGLGLIGRRRPGLHGERGAVHGRNTRAELELEESRIAAAKGAAAGRQ